LSSKLKIFIGNTKKQKLNVCVVQGIYVDYMFPQWWNFRLSCFILFHHSKFYYNFILYILLCISNCSYFVSVLLYLPS